MPFLYGSCADVIDVTNHVIRQTAAAIQTFAAKLRNFTLLARDHHAWLEIKFGGCFTPDGD